MIVFESRGYHLRTCRLLPLTADSATTAAWQIANLDPWLTLGYQPEQLTSYLHRPDASLYKFLVLTQGREAGIVCCRYPWLFGPYLELLAIYPPFQSRGLGQEILAWLEIPKTFTNLWTTVSSFNLRALNFYTRVGFLQVALLPNLVRPDFTEILLRKIL